MFVISYYKKLQALYYGSFLAEQGVDGRLAVGVLEGHLSVATVPLYFNCQWVYFFGARSGKTQSARRAQTNSP